MSASAKDLVGEIFHQLRILRETVFTLEALDRSEVGMLRGNQTVDVDGAMQLSFRNLQGQIAAMEETLATIAEASGQIPKL